MKHINKLLMMVVLILSLGNINQSKAQLVFTEIMYNPPESGTDSLEFIELYNSGSSAVDLNGYTLAFGGLTARYTFTTNYNVQPLNFVVFAVNANAVRRNFNLTFTPLQWSTSGLNNTGTNIKLFSGPVSSSSVTIVDSVSYTNLWVTSSNANGTSMVFCPSSGDNSVSTNWKASTAATSHTVNAKALFGSPGALESVISLSNQPTSIVSCVGSSVAFSVTAIGLNLNYQWKKGSTNVGTNAAALTFTNVSVLDADIYNVEITDDCGTIISNTVALTVNALPNIAVNSGEICAGQAFTMTPSGADTYTYSNGSDVVMPSADVTYTVTGTDVNGCENIAISSVTVNALPVIISETGNVTVCGDVIGTFSLVTTNTDTYAWEYSFNSGSPTAINGTYGETGYNTAVMEIPTLESEGWDGYYITCILTSTEGCTLASTPKFITVNELPILTVNSGVICAGQSFTMIPSGASTYTYSNGSDVVMPSIDVTYTVTGTDSNGCENTAVASVTVNALPVLMASTSNTILCTGEAATLSVTGATSYTWSTTETTSDIVVTPMVQTTYTVDGLDANGCTNSTTIMQDVSLCTGIATLSSNNNSINVYPNPNNGLFVIDLTVTSQVIVANALGEVVISDTMESGKHNIDIHSYATGIYFVKGIVGGKQHVIKLIRE